VGVHHPTLVWPPGTTFEVPPKTARKGPSIRNPRATSGAPLSIGELAKRLTYRTVTWREGTRGNQSSRFAAVRIHTAHRHTIVLPSGQRSGCCASGLPRSRRRTELDAAVVTSAPADLGHRGVLSAPAELGAGLGRRSQRERAGARRGGRGRQAGTGAVAEVGELTPGDRRSAEVAALAPVFDAAVEVGELAPGVSVSALFDGAAVALFDGSGSRSRHSLGRAGWSRSGSPGGRSNCTPRSPRRARR
jgi:hypothetical protein